MARRPITSPNGKPRYLAAVHPNAGLGAAYRKKLDVMIDAMHRSLNRWILAQYRETPPLAQDAVSPARSMQKEMAELGAKWLDRFDKAAPELAAWFAKSVADRSDFALAKTLSDAGISVKFQISPVVRDVMEASLAEQVNLIKSIPAEHLARVEGMVHRSVSVGRDVGGLARDLQEAFGITKRRAATIARSQNSIATATIHRARQQELGITQAGWLHSGGGKHPRPSHVAASGKPYDIAKGWYDPDAKVWTWPGVLPGCRCVSKSIIPGLDD